MIYNSETFSTGNIFDIRRFSTHDGGGIRTTVFLKGCPLSCVWCQNPEGIAISKRLVYFQARCIHCYFCVKACSKIALSVEKSQKAFDISQKQDIVINQHLCEQLEDCIDICPTQALRMDSKTMSVNQIVDEVEKDKPFFAHGGGVTFSGGEPLLQYDFLFALLQECKKRNIHTAIETTLFSPWKKIKALLPYLNLVYADCKFFDNQNHIKYVGASNEIIKQNIVSISHYSQTNDMELIVRTPLIPTLTATDNNIENIAEFLAKLNVKYELLNYNPLAEAKYKHVDREYFVSNELNPRKFSKKEMEHFCNIARAKGAKVINSFE